MRLYIATLLCLCSVVQCNLWPQLPLINKFTQKEDEYLTRAEKLMKRTPMVDGHNDFPLLLRYSRNNKIYQNFSFDTSPRGDTDLPRLRKGLVGGQFWSVFVACPRNDTNFQSTIEVRDTLEQIDVTKRLIALYPDDLFYATTPKDVRTAFESGKIASMIGAEGLHQVSASIATIRLFYELGVRYITLTHMCDNPFATSCTSVAAGKPDRGLTPIGKNAIREMNRLGMLIDLSHVSLHTMHDTLSHSLAPPIFSHSSAFTIHKHERNVPDAVLKRLQSTDGVIMINFYKGFISGERKCTVHDVARHILHVVQVAGWRHVGIGSDFDGIEAKCEGLEDVSMYPNLVAAVLRMAPETKDEEIAGLLGENVLRVWEKVEEVRESLKSKKPSEDIWDGREGVAIRNPIK